MSKLKYTPRIVELISSGQKLCAIKEAKERYYISLETAKNMIDAYKSGDEYYDDSELCSFSTTKQENKKAEGAVSTLIKEDVGKPNVLPFACPNCGDTHVHKSIGGHVEQAAAWGGAKLLMHGIQSFFGTDFNTHGAEGKMAKEWVPAQYVCDYCHQTFHTTKAKVDNGTHSMAKSKSDNLKEAYNRKLQVVKDKEVAGIKDKASQWLVKTFVALFVFLIGLLVCISCEHTAEGLWGTTVYTGSFIFSCVIMFVGVALTAGFGITCQTYYNMASEIKAMSIEQYAKDHKA